MNDVLSNLSILIVTWKGDSLLKNCLDSLTSAVGTLPEVVVVDNADESSTRELVAHYPNAKYVPSPGNPGFAGGNNIGLEHTTHDYILLLNNDTIIHTDSFTPLMQFLQTHPTVGIVQGTMNIPGVGLDVCGEDLMPWGLLHHRLMRKPVETTPRENKRVTAAKGAMLMFKRKVLDDLGGVLFYDHFKNYFEDIDFCIRAGKAGWETWFVDTPPIDHLCGRTLGRVPGYDVWAQYFRNILFSFHHNFGFWGHVFTIPCFTLAAFIKSPRALVKALGNADA